MTFVTGKPDFPTPEEIYGTPEEIIQDARSYPDLPLETLWARCLRCDTVQAVGRYVYSNELVTLPDGTSTSADDWKYAAQVANHLRGHRWKFHCTPCDLVTAHIAVKGR